MNFARLAKGELVASWTDMLYLENCNFSTIFIFKGVGRSGWMWGWKGKGKDRGSKEQALEAFLYGLGHFIVYMKF